MGLTSGPVVACILLVILLVMSALVSGSEVAFFSLKKADLDNLDANGGAAGQRVINLRHQPRRLLGTILVANNFINIAIVVISEYVIWTIFSHQLFSDWSGYLLETMGIQWMSQDVLARVINFTITVFGITFLLVLFGEIAPKIYAKTHMLRMARLMALPLEILMRLFAPITAGLVSLSNAIETRILANGGSMSASREDLEQAIELTVVDEEDSKEEADILRGIVKFNEVTVKQIMRNRVDVIGIDITTPYAEVLKLVEDCGYSRLPVYSEDFDNVVGILYVKDLINHLDEPANFEWQEVIRTETLYVPEMKKINDLMKEFQAKRMHIAIVVDEYGGSSGLVTLEDVMEEVIGEIKDEKDVTEEFDFVKVDDYNYFFDGKTQINDVCRIMDIDADDFNEERGEADTIAGLILEIHGMIPRKDMEFKVGDDYTLKVIEVSKRRIERVQITIAK